MRTILSPIRRTVTIATIAASITLCRAQTDTSALIQACEKSGYEFSPQVKSAFLTLSKNRALADLKAQSKSLPAEFLTWIEADPERMSTVYGAHEKPADVLLHLYALQLDLGKEKFEKYEQLALASAIVSAKREEVADITPRESLVLNIGGDPRVPVDTKATDRPLDMNDHIINFLNEHTITEDVVIGYKEILPKLKYDARGIAIPTPKKKKPKKEPITEKRTRSLYAADVIASTELQTKFNAYMKSKGQGVQINSGDRVVHWKSRDAVKGEQRTRVKEAYMLFRTAYEEKGLLPPKRDPFPTPSEKCAYIIRNFEYKFPKEQQEKRKWPRFPITAPWPVMTVLVADNQPLREREERWIAFRDEGTFKTYGEYIGGIAQQHDMQSARRLTPHPFTYSTIQMMLKDGGVCGTMGNISARSHITLGIPSCTAGQPGHCALIAYRQNPKTGDFYCKGGQYATGGDDKTTPHAIWTFGKVKKRVSMKRGKEVTSYPRKPMIYHQSIAWAANHGMPSFLDSTLAHAIYQELPDQVRTEKGTALLSSGLTINPYNFLLIDSAQAAAKTPQEQIRIWRDFQALVSKVDQLGCPTEGLYNTTVKKRMLAKLAELPAPESKSEITEVIAFLKAENCNIPTATVKYQLALEGLPTLLSRTEKAFTEHLASGRTEASRTTDTTCTMMAATLKAAADSIPDKKKRRLWAQNRLTQTQGKEKYFGHKYRLNTDPSVPTLSKLAKKKAPAETLMLHPVMDQLTAELKASLSGQRSLKNCRVRATKIKNTASRIKDPAERLKWYQSLAKVTAGKETFKPANAKKKAKPIADPCATTITAGIKALKDA